MDEDAAAEQQAAPEFALIQAEVERNLLGGEMKYTRDQVAEVSGVPLERAQRLWVAMGFAMDTNPDAPMFTDADVAALRSITSLVDAGIIDAELEVPVTRALGQSFARLAEWQLGLLNSHILERVRRTGGAGEADVLAVAAQATLVAEQMLPTLQSLQSYVWRRHLASNAARFLDSGGKGSDSRTLVIGFADMVGYTSLTRRIDIDELTRLLEDFESTATTVISQGRGWVIKNLGDEVMFAVEEPADAAQIALALQDAALATVDLPALRVGMAQGPVLLRFGDVYGSVVNIAARLTSSARPGAVLVDSALASALEGDHELRLRSLRSLRVRGFSRLKAHALRRARDA
ncbi:adenylate/guanylate cyclase domain-containing protein [Rhodococcus sp. NPDC058514]|uniref:adenylate/guanylate cyclase domain-containing protein n=1 Tax=unclassified Rhodococcus (in: high G+C Gram-positive bacteria) TaxID=192944 RepID=UPI00365FCAA5